MAGPLPESAHAVLTTRRAGILLHPTSLPGANGNGDLGADAFRFVDFLADTGISVWQTLPHGPTHGDRSPYQCLSVHAGNPLWINIDALVQEGWLQNIPEAEGASPGAWRRECLHLARRGFDQYASKAQRADYASFVSVQHYWLEDFSLYMVLHEKFGQSMWLDWPPALRDRDPVALEDARVRLADEIEQVRFEQFAFFRQWHALKRHANARGVSLFGDLPIFVAYDSADVWACREQFDLDAHGNANTVAGVPPDYFSATGQRWGNPHYRWEQMAAEGFGWWRERVRSCLALYDLVRIDHFRGFEAYWSIPADADTAIDGHWVAAPGEALFRALLTEFGQLPLVAEDLGVITPEVDDLRRAFGFPGMKILQFAFNSGADNPYLPHQHELNSVVYTGTHDNDTTVGWYAALSPQEQEGVLEYLGHPAEPMPWPLVRTALSSVARLAVVPLQDVLALGTEHRMNIPGVTEGNWRWRFQWHQLTDELAGRLHHLVHLYGRAGHTGNL